MFIGEKLKVYIWGSKYLYSVKCYNVAPSVNHSLQYKIVLHLKQLQLKMAEKLDISSFNGVKCYNSKIRLRHELNL